MNDAAAESSVIAEVAHGVGRLVLNKPRMLNALDPEAERRPAVVVGGLPRQVRPRARADRVAAAILDVEAL